MTRSKHNNETFLEYKQRVLDTKSASFCGAKWYGATIWLGSGMTTSCHHPLPHKIPLEGLADNPSLLHNTPEKKEHRRQMQTGERPAGCEYCWKIEDSKVDAISDRPYKSMIYSEEELNTAAVLPHTQDVNLRTLEIAFDRTCNFACSYCNPAFSTTWVKDIKTQGAYNNLVSDGRNHFTHVHDAAQLYSFSETNPYVEAFFKWWDTDLHKTLRELRITGGEPLMSAHTWKLLEWFKTNNSDCKLAINSNLGLTKEKLAQFIDTVKNIPHLEIYTSNESNNTQAEYIRDGLDFKQWYDNINTLARSGVVKQLHVMATVNGLSLIKLPEFLSSLMYLKKVYGKNWPTFTLNILRFPSFQSPTVMPDAVKLKAIADLEWFLNFNRESDLLHDMEREHVQRLIDYLRDVAVPHAGASAREILERDFKQFYTQYDIRRNKDFLKTFPELREWHDRIQL
jgi:organic radical activating enzyme